MMKRVFGVKKEKLKEEVPLPSVQDASNRSTKRGETVDEKIRKLDATLSRYRERIKRTRPGPAREAIKARAVRVLKQKRIYEADIGMAIVADGNWDALLSCLDEGLNYEIELD